MTSGEKEAHLGDSARGDPAMTDLSERIELIEMALEGVTPGPWQTVQTRTDIQRLTVAGPSEIVCGLDGICEPDRMNDRLFAEDVANMRYISACNPVAISELLAAARQAEALQQEVAELRDVMKDCHAALKMMVTPGDISGSTVASAFAAATSAECRARTLLNGGSDAHD